MRKGEILSLNWRGYDHETKTITLQAARAKTALCSTATPPRRTT